MREMKDARHFGRAVVGANGAMCFVYLFVVVTAYVT